MNKKLYISPEVDIFTFIVEPMLAGTPSEGGQVDEGLSGLAVFDTDDTTVVVDDEEDEEEGTTNPFTLPGFHSLWD